MTTKTEQYVDVGDLVIKHTEYSLKHGYCGRMNEIFAWEALVYWWVGVVSQQMR